MIINHKNNNNFKKIIFSFSEIDKKIYSLQQSSAHDFDGLYKLTKKIYFDAKKIDQNTIKLFDQFNDDININFFKNINNIKCDLDKYIFLNKKNVILNAGSLEKLLTIFHLLFVPLNNIKQNLLILSFFATQLKLRFTLNNNASINNEIKNLNILIDKTKLKYDLTITEINDLKKNISEIINKIKKLSNNLNHFEKLLKFINIDINNIKLLRGNVKKQYLLIKKHTKQSSDSIDIVITNLQYQDIIHQKTQHVQQTYKQIVDELNLVKQLPNDEITPAIQLKQIPRLALVAKIQSDQLITTNKDYQNTIDIINKNLSKINKNLSSVKTINLDIFYDYLSHKKNKLNNFRKINKLNSDLLQNLYQPEDEIDAQFNNIKKSIIKVSENFNSFKITDNYIHNIIINIVEKINLPTEQNNDFFSFTQQINSIYDNIHKYNLKIGSILKESSNILKKIKISTGNNHKNEFSNFLSRLTNTFNQFNYINNETLEIENNNINLINGLISKIKNITEEIKYYNFFEETVADINTDLNNIIQLLKQNNQDYNDDKIKYFDNYTTNTEREVHDNVINNKKYIAQDKNKENDVEFF